ncbi:MAG: nucleotidyltransferase domain-containing protein [Anaerolineae bacterium]
MMEINLGLLETGPHAQLIQEIAQKCASDEMVQAIWVGGSLASGTGDQFSDIDLRIAVEPDQIGRWVKPDWNLYLPIQVCGSSFMRFGEHALLHHLVMADGTIVDFYVQDTTRTNHEPNVVILGCRNKQFLEMLEGFATPAASLTYAINGSQVRQFFVDYWITTHKQMKALARKYDCSPFVGLYFERVALLRAWTMQVTGKDVGGRITIHVIGKIHEGIRDALSEDQRQVFGMPSRTPGETVLAIEAIREEMGRIGRSLAGKYQFDYPNELEDVVIRMWDENKRSLLVR